MTVAFLKLKNHAVEKVLDYLAYLKARNWSPHAIRMDRGTEFVNETLRTRCHSQGIEFQLTAPYSPSQNGVAEHANRTLVELSRAMLSAAQLPEFLWEPAVAHAVYIRNISYTVHQENPSFAFLAFSCFFVLFRAFYQKNRKSTKKPSPLLARLLSELVKKANPFPKAL